ncbi:hypothetical protein KC950_00090 [Candidatus Saccharibacteria bacterium]|nr:hypothetical protein [Candidatus Saccharibacteria bacterium]
MLEMSWNIALVICVLIFIAFTFVVAFGAPFLPTLKQRVPEALDLIDLKTGQTLLELGSGDGRILIEAAKRDLNAVGYELNPLLVVYSKLITLKYRKQIKIKWGNYWNKNWAEADGIFVFLLQPYMTKLNQKIIKQDKPIKLVSFAFTIPNKKITKEKSGLYLYNYRQSHD